MHTYYYRIRGKLFKRAGAQGQSSIFEFRLSRVSGVLGLHAGSTYLLQPLRTTT